MKFLNGDILILMEHSAIPKFIVQIQTTILIKHTQYQLLENSRKSFVKEPCGWKNNPVFEKPCFSYL